MINLPVTSKKLPVVSYSEYQSLTIFRKKSVADSRWVSPAPPPRPKIFQIVCSFLQNHILKPPLRGLAPLPTGKHGSAPGNVKAVLLVTFVFDNMGFVSKWKNSNETLENQKMPKIDSCL